MNDVIKKIKAIANEIDGCFNSFSVEEALELTDGVVAETTKVNPSTGTKLVVTGSIDGSIKTWTTETKPNVVEYNIDKGFRV